MANTHIVKSYDDDLKNLQKDLVHMGERVIEQVGKALQALLTKDGSGGDAVIQGDRLIDEFEHRIDAFAIRMIALRQPVAQDLRAVIAGLKIASHLERMGDYASNMARRAKGVIAFDKAIPVIALEQIVTLITPMIRDVLNAYIAADWNLARDVWQRDEKVDQLYVSYLRELLTYMMEDTRNITPCIHVLFAAKNMERMGDHVTNIAEMVYYLTHGFPFRESRLPSV